MATDDLAARVRAAAAYAGLDEKRAAKAMGFSTRTLARLESGERDLSVPEAKALAAATGVPLRFLYDGWDASGDLAQTVEELRREVDELRTDQEALRMQTARNVAAVKKQVDAILKRLAPPRRQQRP
jgi:transcriptional regulator with XRE-family HTH domain